MNVRAPDAFEIRWETRYGALTAACLRAHAPVWVDRVFNLALNGYYDRNYFFRVLDGPGLSVVQFGTNGEPDVSNVYNFSSPSAARCSILIPQPDGMPVNVGVRPLSNTRGTLSMSTSFNETTGTTWNATAELFINKGDNARLDRLRFVPFCTLDAASMATVDAFPSFGEVADLGGPGPSLGLLYERGNAYIRANRSWRAMAITEAAAVSCPARGEERGARGAKRVARCGPCEPGGRAYERFSSERQAWVCPTGTMDGCALPGHRAGAASEAVEHEVTSTGAVAPRAGGVASGRGGGHGVGRGDQARPAVHGLRRHIEL